MQRQRTLRSFVKAWREYMGYNRNLMQTNMAAINFTFTNRSYIMKNVFDALRANKEQAKYELLN